MRHINFKGIPLLYSSSKTLQVKYFKGSKRIIPFYNQKRLELLLQVEHLIGAKETFSR